MGLKVLGILLLVVAAVYAENALEVEDPVENQLEDVDEMDGETEVAETEDPTEDDDDDDDMTEDAGRRKKGKKRRRRRRKFPIVVASRRGQCFCKNPRYRKAGKGDEAELEEDETVDDALDEQFAEIDGGAEDSDEEESDEEETEVEDARRKKGGKRKRRRNAIKKLIRSFFSKRLFVTLTCHCTRNRAVIRFLRFLHYSRVVHITQKVAFWRTYNRLLRAVMKQRRRKGKKGDAY